jgi:hypothetical protein
MRVLASGVFSPGFPTKILYVFPAHMLTTQTWPAYIILSGLIIIIVSEEYTFWSFYI